MKLFLEILELLNVMFLLLLVELPEKLQKLTYITSQAQNNVCLEEKPRDSAPFREFSLLKLMITLSNLSQGGHLHNTGGIVKDKVLAFRIRNSKTKVKISQNRHEAIYIIHLLKMCNITMKKAFLELKKHSSFSSYT